MGEFEGSEVSNMLEALGLRFKRENTALIQRLRQFQNGVRFQTYLEPFSLRPMLYLPDPYLPPPASPGRNGAKESLKLDPVLELTEFVEMQNHAGLCTFPRTQ